MFDERCIFVQYDLPNTKKRKKICTYENRINFITKWGQPMESTEIGGEAKVYESLWSGVRKPICDIVFCVIDFDVLTFYFCILCIMLHILNGAIHEVEPRWRRV